jgi:hypothetical protein
VQPPARGDRSQRQHTGDLFADPFLAPPLGIPFASQRGQRQLRLGVDRRPGVLDALQQIKPLVMRQAARIDVQHRVDQPVHAFDTRTTL